MRILFLTDRFTPGTGGVERSSQLTAEALTDLGHEVVVLTENVYEAPEFDALPSGVSVRRFTVPRVRPLTTLLYWKKMWSYRVFLRQFDVLHFHDFHTLLYWFGPLRLLLRGPVYAMTFHGFEGWPIRRRHNMLRRLAAAMTDVRFGVGEYLRSVYSHPIDHVFIGAPVHVKTCPQNEEGAENIKENSSGRDNSFEEDHAADFAYAGRHAPDTGIGEAMEALSSMARKSSSVCRVNMAGDGPLRPALHSFEHENFRIRHYGVMSDPSPCLENATCIIATGFLSILDAFALGKPVLIPAFTEVKQRYIVSIPGIEDMAWIASTPEHCADLGRSLLEGNESTTRKIRSAKQFVSACSWSNIALTHLQAYESARRAE